MTEPRPGPDPAAGAREVAQELALLVARVSARDDLPADFAAELLEPDHDGALSILLEASDQPGRGLAPGLLAQLVEGLATTADRVSRSRAVVPLVESLRHHPELAAELLAREEVLEALVAGPRRPRLDRALVRVLEAVAPLRAPRTVASVVRRLGRPDVRDRLSRGAAALLLESFDDLAGLALGVDDWMPLEVEELAALVRRLREDPVLLSRLSTRCAAHGRGRMLVALTNDPALLDGALQQSVRLFAFLAPDADQDEAGRAAYLRVVTRLMRLTALQLLLAERPDLVPPRWWPRGRSTRPAGTGFRWVASTATGSSAIVESLDAHSLLLTC